MSKDKNMPYTHWATELKNDPNLKLVSLAFKALEKGTASPEQQQYAMKFLITRGCRTHDSDWFEDDRLSSFAAGRRFVGMQIIDMVNLKISKLNEQIK